jgi:mannosyl-3-phosphoglycerate phosphatase
MPWLVFTDLDGTLLDGDTYAWEPARPALDALAAAGIPVVLNSSKTRAEIDAIRSEIGHDGPFIVENGAALFMPADEAGSGTARDRCVARWGSPYPTLLAVLERAARQAGVTVRGFHQMTDEEVAERCGLTLDRARLARRREYDEPFLVPGAAPEAVTRLEALVREAGFRLTRGDRFCHVLGQHDKATAARATAELYRRGGGGVRTIALGGAANDVELLAWADIAVIVGTGDAPALAEALPRARLAAPGPDGWNRAMLDILAEIPAAGPPVSDRRR